MKNKLLTDSDVYKNAQFSRTAKVIQYVNSALASNCWDRKINDLSASTDQCSLLGHSALVHSSVSFAQYDFSGLIISLHHLRITRDSRMSAPLSPIHSPYILQLT